MASRSHEIRIGVDVIQTANFVGRTLPGLSRLHAERPEVQFIALRQNLTDARLLPPDLSGLLAHFTPSLHEAAVGAGLPMVSILRCAVQSLPMVTTDDRACGRLAGEHIIERRFTASGFFFDGSMPHYSEARLAGLRQVLEPAGITPDVFLVGPRTQAKGKWTYADQIADLGDWLAAKPKPYALMAAADDHAQRAVEACNAANLSIPDEVAIIGVGDDKQFCQFCDPPLTSVAVDAATVGYEAARWLVDIIEGKRAQVAKVLELPPLGMVERRSTDVYAVSDSDVSAALQLINDSADRPLRVEDVAAHLNISRSTLERKFREVLGATPGDTIRRTRLGHAVRRLIETDQALVDVALDCGFTTVSQLSRDIKRHTGQTPTQIRRSGRVVQ